MSSDRKAYMKEWRENNKAYMKEWRENNKEYHKEWWKNNKQHIQEYRENNKQHIQEQKKEYYQTEAGLKSNRISKWKHYEGMSQDYDWDIIYDIYISTDLCDYCNVKLVEGNYGSNKKCLDHNHKTGEIRGILCNTCNSNEVFRYF